MSKVFDAPWRKVIDGTGAVCGPDHQFRATYDRRERAIPSERRSMLLLHSERGARKTVLLFDYFIPKTRTTSSLCLLPGQRGCLTIPFLRRNYVWALQQAVGLLSSVRLPEMLGHPHPDAADLGIRHKRVTIHSTSIII